MTWILFLLHALLFETAPEGEEEETPPDPEDDEGEEDEEVRNPRLKAVSAEAKHWRLLYRKAEAKIAELEAGGVEADALRAARLESAFLRTVLAAGQTIDIETAWDLANARGFLDAVKDDGDGMEEAFARVLDRYPWLTDAPAVSEPGPTPPAIRGARKRQDPSAGQSRTGLESRFPALKRGR